MGRSGPAGTGRIIGVQRFDGAIAGLGTAAGVRIVLGMWRASPFGPIADAMIERADGHRVLAAPRQDVADYIAATYRFDEVRVEDVTLHIAGDVRTFASATLTLRIESGPRTVVGRLLSLVPDVLARSRWWCRLIDPFARIARRGARTVGTAGGGRREWYCALDEHRLVAAHATFEGTELGALRPVRPPVRFGFASTPAVPSIVDVTTWVADA
jgi:hypothetical protein